MPPATKQVELQVEIVKQHPGPQQVERSVVVDVPGKHFPQLQTAEQKIAYPGTAVEFAERLPARHGGRRLSGHRRSCYS